MLAVKGKFDGQTLRLDQDVRIDHEVSVVVTFLDPVTAAPHSASDYRDFLLAGPTIPPEQLQPMLDFIEDFRQWKA